MSPIQPVQEHYKSHLGPIYAWSVGDISTALARARDQLTLAGVMATQGEVAVDLGCGIGLHTVPLAERGYRVLALDFCAELIADLRIRVRGLPVTVVEADIRDFVLHLFAPPRVIVCLGDTLTHLPDLPSVERLLGQMAEKLTSGGRLSLSFRDYVGTELTGTERFIPVRADDRRVMTCFLEYRATTVAVHDLLYEKNLLGWQFRVSAYQKLRLDRQWVATRLARHGMNVIQNEVANGVVTLNAIKRG